MRKILIPVLFALVGTAGANAAFAHGYEEGDGSHYPGHPELAFNSEPTANERAPLGYTANAHPSRVINLEKGAKYLNVTRMETVQINVAGKSVTWTFDTLGTPSFSLSKIIPGVEGITVYVSEDINQLG